MKLKVLNKYELKPIVGVVVGTRPSIMKMGPIIKELERRKIKHFVIHAGQHYSHNMAQQFFDEFELKQPKYWLRNIKNYKLHGAQTAGMLKGIEQILLKERPKFVAVCADANFNLAGALATRKLGIKLGHVESGLRSNDWRMPEEHNRIMIDHISEYLFAPTQEAKQNLIKDNIKGKIIVTGNTITDAIKQNLAISQKRSKILKQYNLKPKKYFLITAHREENVDQKDILIKLMDSFKKIGKLYDDLIIFPIHPRTKKRLKEFKLWDKLNTIKNVKVIHAPGYHDFLCLLGNCKLVMTDSGGIQEESCILQIPCLTLRDNTERPETVTVGANIITSVDPARICKGIKQFLNKKKSKKWSNPFGEFAARKIVDIIIAELKN